MNIFMPRRDFLKEAVLAPITLSSLPALLSAYQTVPHSNSLGYTDFTSMAEKEPLVRAALRRTVIPYAAEESHERMVSTLSITLGNVARWRERINLASPQDRQTAIDQAVDSTKDLVCNENRKIDPDTFQALCHELDQYNIRADRTLQQGYWLAKSIDYGSAALGTTVTATGTGLLPGVALYLLGEGTSVLVEEAAAGAADRQRRAPRDETLLRKAEEVLFDTLELYKERHPDQIEMLDAILGSDKLQQHLGTDLTASVEQLILALPKGLRDELDKVAKTPENLRDILHAKLSGASKDRKDALKQATITRQKQLSELTQLDGWNDYAKDLIPKGKNESSADYQKRVKAGFAIFLARKKQNDAETRRNDFEATVGLLGAVASLTADRTLGDTHKIFKAGLDITRALDQFAKHPEQVSTFALSANIAGIVIGLASSLSSRDKPDPVLEAIKGLHEELHEIKQILVEGLNVLMQQNDRLLTLAIETLSQVRQGRFFNARKFDEILDELDTKSREDRLTTRERTVNEYSSIEAETQIHLEQYKDDGRTEPLIAAHNRAFPFYAITAKTTTCSLAFNGHPLDYKTAKSRILRAFVIGGDVAYLSGMLPVAAEVLTAPKDRNLPKEIIAQKEAIAQPNVWATAAGSLLDLREVAISVKPYSKNSRSRIRRELRDVYRVGKTTNEAIISFTSKEALHSAIEAYRARGKTVAKIVASKIKSKANELWNPKDKLGPTNVPIVSHMQDLSVGQLYFASPTQFPKAAIVKSLPKGISYTFCAVDKVVNPKQRSSNDIGFPDAANPLLLAEALGIAGFSHVPDAHFIRGSYSIVKGPMKAFGTMPLGGYKFRGENRSVVFLTGKVNAIRKFKTAKLSKSISPKYGRLTETASGSIHPEFALMTKQSDKESIQYLSPLELGILAYRSQCADELASFVNDVKSFDVVEEFEDFEVTADSLGLLMAYGFWRTEGQPSHIERMLPIARVAPLLSSLDSSCFDFMRQGCTYRRHEDGGLEPMSIYYTNCLNPNESAVQITKQANSVWEDVESSISKVIDRAADEMRVSVEGFEQDRGLYPIDRMLELFELHAKKNGIELG